LGSKLIIKINYQN